MVTVEPNVRIKSKIFGVQRYVVRAERHYRFAGDRLPVHVGGRRGQGLPISSFIVGDDGSHLAVHPLIGQEDPFDPAHLRLKHRSPQSKVQPNIPDPLAKGDHLHYDQTYENFEIHFQPSANFGMRVWP